MAADLVVLVHAGFVIFVVLGGLLAFRWPRALWVHAPAAIWGILVEYAGLICPLTPLEIALRERAGRAGYHGGFVEHYVNALLYPTSLTRELQVAFGTLALLVNVIVYWRVLRRRSPRTSHPGAG
jgi:hypothetical protein